MNFWRGCRKVSPGCDNCYITRTPPFRISGQKHGKERKRSQSFDAPLAWNKRPWICDRCGTAYADTMKDGTFELCPPCFRETNHSNLHRRRVFALSLGDMFDAEVPLGWRAEAFSVIKKTPNLDYLILTKRPQNVLPMLDQIQRHWMADKLPLFQNIWLGTSVENQAMADKRIPELLGIPATVRFLSVEPMLGPIDLQEHLLPTVEDVQDIYAGREPEHPRVHWAIFGGESGQNARPCDVEWIRDGVRQCRAAGVAPFCKQLGSNVVSRNDAGFEGEGETEWPMDTHYKELDPMDYQGAPVRVLLKDKKGGDPSEWPEDLRVREFPNVHATV